MSNDGKIMILILTIVSVLTIIDLYYRKSNANAINDDHYNDNRDVQIKGTNRPNDENDYSENRDLNKQRDDSIDEANRDRYSNYEPKFKYRFNGPHLTFFYCFSCGYKQAFDEFSKIVADRYPSIRVEGQNYAPSYARALTAQFLTYSKIALIAAILLGSSNQPQATAASGHPQGSSSSFAPTNPSIYQWALSNKLYACTMIFFVGNAIETYLISTGAFEIAYNGVPIWSKLDVGRFPSPQELIQIIESHNRLSASAYSDLKQHYH